MSGLELQAKLNTDRCRIPIIFITGTWRRSVFSFACQLET